MKIIMALGILLLSLSASAAQLRGVNYSHWQISNCSSDNTGILLTYHQPGVRTTVQRQLQQMRINGVDVLKLGIWHAPAAEMVGATWGVIPSTGGVLTAQHAANLAAFVADVRAAGYATFQVSMAPSGATTRPTFPDYDPASFTENWHFLQHVRAIVQANRGAMTVRYDIWGEGAPANYETSKAHAMTYLTALWKAYVLAYGWADASVSVIGPGCCAGPERLDNLLTALKASRQHLPGWYDVHVYGQTAASATTDLATMDATLRRWKLRTSPVQVGETWYADPLMAQGIQAFDAQSSRPVSAILQWPLLRGSACQNFSETPPYTVGPY